MDQRPVKETPREILRQIARAYLSTPAVDRSLGEIRLAPHQLDAATQLLAMIEQSGGAVLADATGLGKTFVAIAVARLLSPAVIVAPAALRGMWLDSLGRARVAAEVVTYETLSRNARPRTLRPALVILDEAHHARNPHSKRYAAIADITWGSNVLLVTATPVHNRGRDLRALAALFCGSHAYAMTDEELRRLIVRRTATTTGTSAQLPGIAHPTWLEVPADPLTFAAITALPPAVPLADGRAAHALLVLGLLRAWSSSEAALHETLRRRLRRAAVVAASLESGRLPDRRELERWPILPDAIQLGFADLLSSGTAPDREQLRETLEQHVEGVRAVLSTLQNNGGATDQARHELLHSVRADAAPVPVVAFTQFEDTASATYRAVAPRGAVALVTGRGARIASGSVATEEIVQRFDTSAAPLARAMPLDLLVATDVLSEGLSLRRAGVIVHLDLPWTMARLEQRVGRLRRVGSPHRSIRVFAIGPPCESRALATVLRSLQRKARAASILTGSEELVNAMPLFGQRLSVAMRNIEARTDYSSVNELRRVMSSLLDGDFVPRHAPPRDSATVALVEMGARQRLVSVTAAGISERATDVLRAMQVIASSIHSDAYAPDEEMERAHRRDIQHWLDEQFGRTIVKHAVENGSSAHARVLRALDYVLSNKTRVDRVSLSAQVQRCRELMLSSRGIGAELALEQFMHGDFDMNALERLLESRARPGTQDRDRGHLVAMISTARERPSDGNALGLDRVQRSGNFETEFRVTWP